METIRRYSLVLALAGLFLCLWSPISAQTHTETGAVQADEFCGATPPPEIVCPETRASVCLCVMRSKTTNVESEFNPPLTEVEKKPAPRRKRTSYRLLPSFSWTMSLATFEESVPTPPPRI